MNKVWMRALVIAIVVIHCGSAHAGWFDGQKKAKRTKKNTSAQVQQAKQNTSAQVQQAKATLPIIAATAMPKKNIAATSAQPAVAASVNQTKTSFFDVGGGDAKSDLELNRENQEKEKNMVRLSGEELEKMKAEMDQLNQSIKVVQEAKQAVANVKTTTDRVAVPVIPKMPTLPNVQKTPLSVVVKPATVQNMNAPTKVSGYKK